MGGERIEQGKADRDAAVRRITMKYTGVITIKDEGKESTIYVEFEKDDVYDILRAYDVMLNHAKADEVAVYARRWEA